MKPYLGLMTAAALALSACGHDNHTTEPSSNQATATASATTSSATASASSDSHVATATATGECATTINSTDQMTYTSKEINIKSSCKDFTITLQHEGSAPKAAMGHNIVITKATDKDGVLTDGMASGADKDYLKADDARVIAATKLIGGGESDTITFPVSKLAKGESYVFFCTFPGHASLMNGKVNLVN